jgi:hypothetical protein
VLAVKHFLRSGPVMKSLVYRILEYSPFCAERANIGRVVVRPCAAARCAVEGVARNGIALRLHTDKSSSRTVRLLWSRALGLPGRVVLQHGVHDR